MEQKKDLLIRTKSLIKSELSELQNKDNMTSCSRIEVDACFIAKQKGIYETMNLFKNHGFTLVVDCWIPTKYQNKVQDALQLNQYSDTVRRNHIQGQM